MLLLVVLTNVIACSSKTLDSFIMGYVQHEHSTPDFKNRFEDSSQHQPCVPSAVTSS